MTVHRSESQRTIVLASNNEGKIAEFSSLLAPLGVRILPQRQFNISAAEEPYDTFVENALAKARHASAAAGLPAIADDSGLCVEALAGAPGVLSARYACAHKSQLTDQKLLAQLENCDTDAANNALLLHHMQGIRQRRAYFVASLVYVRHPQDPTPLIAQGFWWGEIASAPRGTHGFGYDPVFWIPELHCTAAELDAQRKNNYSHRGQALKSLLHGLTAMY